MAIRTGFITAAHLHIWGYAHAMKQDPEFEVVGIWDDDPQRRWEFAERAGIPEFERLESLLEIVDAVVIVSENVRHFEFGMKAIAARKHVLCEKPLVTELSEGQKLIDAARDKGVVLMTAFPCPYSPAFQRLRQKIDAGDIGAVRAICSTNRGRCPFGWFVEAEKSGGGAMIDHTVHVADLLHRILGKEPTSVVAQAGHNMYGKSWEDTAMLTLSYPDGIFATLDSSWSRPSDYKTWGDVTMNVIGEKGVIELNLFGQQLDIYANGAHTVAGYGSDLDAALVADFARAIMDGRAPNATGEDGLRASRVALAAYASLKVSEPISLSS